MIPILAFTITCVLASLLSHTLFHKYLTGAVCAAILAVAGWVIGTSIFLIRTGGEWHGFSKEIPYMLNASLLCAVIAFPIALGIGIPFRNKRKEHSPTRN